jgi:hypothetical protein
MAKQTTRLSRATGCRRCSLISTQLFGPLFSRLRRLMCGRSLTFREVRIYLPGLRPTFCELQSSPSKTIFVEFKLRGHSPHNGRSALAEGRRPSAHRAAEPRRKKTLSDIGCRAISIARSSEVLHQHNVAAALINARIKQPAAVRRSCQTWRALLNCSIKCRHLSLHPSRGEAEEFNHRTGWRLSSGKIDALFRYGPGAPMPRFL